MLILICGLPGVGKTKVAEFLSGELGAFLLRADVIRKEIYKIPTYSKQEIDSIYEEMFKRAMPLLEAENKVILEAVFFETWQLDKAEETAKKYDSSFKIIEVVCREEYIKKRISLRSNDASDADFAVYLKYKEIFDPIKQRHVVLDNSGSVEQTQLEVSKIAKELSDV